MVRSIAAALPFVVLSTAAFANGYVTPTDTAPITVTPPSTEWSGGYIGGSLAGVFSSAYFCDNFDGDEYDCDDPDQDQMPNPTPEGGMLGITGGYDWQNGPLVYGVAGDIMFGNLSDVAASNLAYGCGGGCGLDVNYMAMLRGRVGYDMGDFMPFATAGVAVTGATVFEEGDPTVEVDGTYTNLVFGVGGEYRISRTLSGSLDVLHLFENTGNPIINNDFCGDCGAASFSATMVRQSLAYRF